MKETPYVSIIIITIIMIAAAIVVPKEISFFIILGMPALALLFSRFLFKKIPEKHPEAFSLTIQLVAVVVGVYIALYVTNKFETEGEKKKLITIINATKANIFECSGHLRKENEENIVIYLKSDSIFRRIRGSKLRTQFPRPSMYEYITNTDLSIKYIPADIFRWIVAEKYYTEKAYDLFESTVQPTIEIYKKDLQNMMAINKLHNETLEILLNYMNGKVSSDSAVRQIYNRSPIPIMLWTEDTDWYKETIAKNQEDSNN